MITSKPPLQYVHLSICFLALLPSGIIPAKADPNALELKSPKDNDHFEVTKPMFYWQTDPAAKGYSLIVDDTSVDIVPDVSLPVMHCGFTTDLTAGPHQWRLKETKNDGTTVVSETRSFIIDPPHPWPDWAIGPFERYGANPILRPQGTTWESVNALSPGVLFDQGLYRMLYRAQGKPWPSVEGYAESVDGVTFTRNPNPWSNANATSYAIQVSDDGTNWVDIYTTTSGKGGVDDLLGLKGQGRYIRMLGTKRANPGYGYSLVEFEVYGH